jgi:hypothetical protein
MKVAREADQCNDCQSNQDGNFPKRGRVGRATAKSTAAFTC